MNVERLLRVPFRFPLYQLLPERIGGSFVKAPCLDGLTNGFHLVVYEQVVGLPSNLVGQAFIGGFFRRGFDRSSLVRRDMSTFLAPGRLFLFALVLVFVLRKMSGMNTSSRRTAPAEMAMYIPGGCWI